MTGLLGVFAVAAPAASAQGIDREPFKTTIQISDGGSANPSISQDDRFSKVIAFESGSQIKAVFRTGAFSNEGEAWQPGEVRVISTGRRGAAANGPSARPDVGGAPGFEPKCIAFISRASNLVPGDTNRKADAFLYSIPSRSIKRVSVDSEGKQANDDTTEVSVSGDCTRVAFTSEASNLAQRNLRGLSSRRRRSWAFAVTGRPSRGKRNVYVKFLEQRHESGRPLNGLTFLASAKNGRPVSGESFDPHLAVLRGDLIAFTSNAALVDSDNNRASDVYVRPLERVRVGPAGGRVGSIRLGTELASKGANGASRRPNMSGTGRFLFFETNATDLIPGDGNGHTDVVRVDRSNNSATVPVSEGPAGTYGNGPSTTPIASGGGTNALYLTEASNFFVPGGPQKNFGFQPTGPGDNNGARDGALWTTNRRISLIETRGSGGELFGDSTNGIDMSHRTNYIVFEVGGRILLRYLGPRAIGN